MFVVMALVTTVSTTPLTKLLYPPWYQQKVEKWRRGEIDWDGNPTESSAGSTTGSVEKLNAAQIRRLVVYLRLDSLPSLFTFITLLGADTTHAAQEAAAAASAAQDTVHIRKRPLEVHGLRLIELTDRTSSVMQVTEGEEYYSAHDPVVNAFRTFSQLHDVAAAGRVAVVPVDSYPETLMSQAADVSSDFALIPWSEYGSVTEDQSVPYSINASERFKSGTHLDFIQKTLARAAETCSAGIFINNGFGGAVKPNGLKRTRSALSIRSATMPDSAVLPVTDKSHHIFFPFFGGVDDRVALRFVLQLATNSVVTLTITHFNFGGAGDETDNDAAAAGTSSRPAQSVPGAAAAPVGQFKSWAAENELSAQDVALLHTLQSSLPEELMGRVTFKEVSASPASVLKDVVEVATSVVGQNPRNAGDIVVVGRRHVRLGDDKGEAPGGDFKRTVGVVADQVIAQAVKASLLVIQAGGRAMES
jgi:hypothetical protein